MREIKFRGKRIDNGEWVVGDLRYSENSIAVACDIRHFGIGYDIYSVSPETVGQFTGLKDKNGKEIYEDDFIQTDNSDVYLVTWVDCTLSYVAIGVIDNLNIISLCDLLDNAIEVIGNRHDNPELLTTE